MRVPGSAKFPSSTRVPGSMEATAGPEARRARSTWPASIRLVGTIAALAASLLLPAASPVAASGSGSGPIVGQDVQHDVSPPLRDLVSPAPQPDPHGIPRDVLENLPTHPGRPTSAVTDPVVQSTSGTAAVSTATNWEGVSNLDGVYPPDTNGDVGPNDYVQWVNLHFAIYSKTGSLLYGPAAGNTLWSGFGGPCATQNSGDPIALYDEHADRWIMAQFTSSSPYGECVAISTTGDPTGSWYRYFFQFSTTVFYDYPKIGVWPDGYYLTANRFSGNTFSGPAAIVLDRTHMLAGQTATFQQFNLSSSFGTLLPADLDGTPPAAGEPEPIAEIGSSALHLWKLHVDWTTPANSNIAGPTSLSVAAYNQLCPTTRSCIPQPGTSVGLDGLGDRLMYRLQYRNMGDHESLVVNHSVNVASSGTHAGVRWYEIRYTGGDPATATLYQQGTFSPDADNRWLGSAAMDSAGNIALGYSVASSSTFASIRVTGRLAADPLGQMTQGETTIMAGSGSQTGSASRWGDYSMMAVDPTDGCTFWFTSEYMPSTGAAPWRTRIASFRLPTCGASATAPAAPVLSGSAGNGQALLSWTTPSNGGSAITGYKVYRGTSSGGETLLTTLPVQNSYTDTAVTNGTTYYYKVTALNTIGESTPSNEVSETPQAPAKPGAPTGLTASGGNGSVALSWAAPLGSTVTSYNIYRGTASGGEGTTAIATSTSTSFTDSTVTNGTTYFYKVTAVNTAGEGPASNEASATPAGATAPSAPQNLSARSATGKGVQLSWVVPASTGGSAITGYQVWRSTTSGGEALLTTLGVVTSYKDSATNRGTKYFYELKAVNAVGASGFSNEASATAK